MISLKHRYGGFPNSKSIYKRTVFALERWICAKILHFFKKQKIREGVKKSTYFLGTCEKTGRRARPFFLLKSCVSDHFESISVHVKNQFFSAKCIFLHLPLPVIMYIIKPFYAFFIVFLAYTVLILFSELLCLLLVTILG